VNARTEVLLGAEELVNGDRDAQYGDPRQDFKRTAAMWAAYLGIEVAPHDVAVLMMLVKASRIRWSPQKLDSWMDAAGYAACGWDCASEDVAAGLATSSDDDDVPAITQHVDKPAAKPAPVAARKPGAGRKPKHDWQAIGEVARLAAGAGQPVAAALAAEFNVNSTTAYWMVKRCRELGYLGESQRFTSEPITRTEVNEQSARERAAAAL
jgi:hypothetical protein